MKSFKEWLKLKNEMAGTGAIYDGSKTYDKNRDWNWWGAPETAGKSPGYAHAAMEKNLKKSKKGSSKQ